MKNGALRISRPLVFAGFGTILFFLFFLLSQQYFQQDEWHSFGLIQAYGLRYITLDKEWWQILFADRVGARVITYALFSLFGTSGIAFGVFSTIVHFINSTLVFFLAKKLTRNLSIALVSSIFFLVNAVGYQAYTWFGTVAGSATSLAFLLISIILYVKFLEERKFSNLLFSLFFVWVSFLFKEGAYLVFILYPLLWFLYSPKRGLLGFLKENAPTILFGLFITYIFAQSVISIPGERANYIAPSSGGVALLAWHIISYPIEGSVQVFLPPTIVFSFSRLLTQIFVPSFTPETSVFDQFYTTKMAEGVSIAIFIVFLFGLFFLYSRFIRRSEISTRRFFKFLILFLFTSFIPYVVIDKSDAYLDLRHYYISSVPASMLLGILSFEVVRQVKWATWKRMTIGIFLLFFLTHLAFLARDLILQVEIAQERKSIIDQITTLVPKRPQRTVFFVTGNSPGYYGLPELKVPFQSGLGQVLMVVYARRGEINPSLFKEETLERTLDAGFLYDTLAQGYKEQGGRGFGFFYDGGQLVRELRNGRFKEGHVISLFYDSDKKIISRQNFEFSP